MIWWGWLIAGMICVFVEMATLTFFFLSVAIACAVSAIVSGADASLHWQLAALSIVTVLSLFVFNRVGLLRFKGRNAHDDSLDIGQTVVVKAWSEEGKATVQYRGANWTARLAGFAQTEGKLPAPGTYVIEKVDGITLVVRPEAQ